MVRGKCKIVGYLRTSTEDQKVSIEAQQETVYRIAKDHGCDVLKVFTEHESGGNNERLELDKAIRHARRTGAILCVAKLDRLARDAQFLMTIFDGDVPTLFGDMPEVDGSPASRFMVQNMAAVAEYERRRMGERMRDWHRARKAKGLAPGFRANLDDQARAKGAAVSAQNRTSKAIEEMSDIAEIATQKRQEGFSLQAIADHLNSEGYPTRKGGTWSAVQVKRILDRLS